MGYKTWPSACILKWANFLALVVSACIISIGIWLATKHGACERYLMIPMFVIGASIFIISLMGYIGASKHFTCLLWIYLIIFTIILLALMLFSVFGFIVTQKGTSYTAKSNGLSFKEYQIENYSHWLQHVSASQLAHGESSVQSGCCRPPVECGYPMINVTYYDLSSRIVLTVSMAKTSYQQLVSNFSNPSSFSISDRPLDSNHRKMNNTILLNLTNSNVSSSHTCKDLGATVTRTNSPILPIPIDEVSSVEKHVLSLPRSPKLVALSPFTQHPIKTIHSTMAAGYSVTDCNLYDNSPNIKCFHCSSCRGGVAQSVKKQWQILAGANIVLVLFLMQKKGLEEMKQGKEPSCSCRKCWRACWDCYCCCCCSRRVGEVEDISSPKNCCGQRKATPNHKGVGQEDCLCCPTKRRKRTTECCEPEKIDLDDLDPTLVFDKKKALQDHDQVPYRREEDLTVLDYLEAGWPIQDEPEGVWSIYFPCLGKQRKKLDTKQKGKANTSCCTSPCGEEMRKGVEFDKNGNPIEKGKLFCTPPCGEKKKVVVDLKDFDKIDNSLAIAGASSGTLVWDKPPPIPQQDSSRNTKEQPQATPVRRTPQMHTNVLFDQGSAPVTLKPKSLAEGQAVHRPPVDDGELPKDEALPQGWSWLMENSNLPSPPKNVDKEPHVQTRYVHILPEILDTRFELKGNEDDDMDIFQKKDKKLPAMLKYKGREDHVETSLVQFAKPEIVDERFLEKRFQLKSKDDMSQKKDEKLQIIEEDVDRLGVIHDKLGILQQQLLQKEQILVLEEKLKEQGQLQRRKEELALEKEQLEMLRLKIQGKAPFEKKNEELLLEKDHFAFLREVMNEKDQLERKKDEFMKEKIELEILRQRMSLKEKEGLNVDKSYEIDALGRPSTLEDKGRLNMKEQEVLKEKERLEMLREQLACKEKAQLEMKKEELSLQLEKTKEELAREKEQLKAMQERLNQQEKGFIEKSKVQLAYEKEQLEDLKEKLNLKDKEQLKRKKEELDDEREKLEELRASLKLKDKEHFKKNKEELDNEKEKLQEFRDTLKLKDKEQVKKKEELDNEKEKLEELRQKLNLEEKEQLKKKKEELQNEKDQLDMLTRENLSKEKILFERKKKLLLKDKDQLKLLCGRHSAHENDGFVKMNLESPSRDSMKNSKDSNGSDGEHGSKEQIKSPWFLPLIPHPKLGLFDSSETQKEPTREGWELYCQTKFYENFVRSCVGGQNDSSLNSNDYGHTTKRNWPALPTFPTVIDNEERAEELFDIENKRPEGNFDLEYALLSKYGILNKGYEKGKQHIEHHVKRETETIHSRKRREDGGSCDHHKGNLEGGQIVKGRDDGRKRPRAVLEYNDNDECCQSIHPDARLYTTEKSDHEKSLTGGDTDKKRRQHIYTTEEPDYDQGLIDDGIHKKRRQPMYNTEKQYHNKLLTGDDYGKKKRQHGYNIEKPDHDQVFKGDDNGKNVMQHEYNTEKPDHDEFISRNDRHNKKMQNMYNIEKPDHDKFLMGDDIVKKKRQIVSSSEKQDEDKLLESDNEKKQQHNDMESNELVYQQQNRSAGGHPRGRFGSSFTKAKQFLSYNFEPPKKRVELEPQTKKVKRSDSFCFMPPNMPPHCGGPKFEFPRWKRHRGRQVEEAERSKPNVEQSGKVPHQPIVDSKDNQEQKQITGSQVIKSKPESRFERPRIKARFRFKGSLDKRAQNEIIGKLKEIELEDLKNRLEEKKKLLEKLEKAGPSNSRNQKSV